LFIFNKLFVFNTSTYSDSPLSTVLGLRFDVNLGPEIVQVILAAMTFEALACAGVPTPNLYKIAT
jgi:hypothetical protein